MGPSLSISSSFNEMHSAVSLGSGASIHWADFSQQSIHSMDFSMKGFSGIHSIEWAQHSQNLEVGSFDFSIVDLSFDEVSNQYCGSFHISTPVSKPVASPTAFSFYSGDVSIDTSLGEFSGIVSTSGPHSSYSFSLGEYSYTQISSAQRPPEPSAISTPAPSAPQSAAPSAHAAEPTTVPSATPAISPPTSQPSTAPTEEPPLLTVSPSALPTVLSTGPPSVGPSPILATEAAPTPMPSTAAPTAGPTPRPSLTPTAEPTRVPSRKPSVAPTVGPTVTPTILPTVLPGRTQNPSRAPTAAPSLSEEALWRLELGKVVSSVSLNEPAETAQRLSYYELDVAASAPSTAVYGSCSDWRSLLNGDLSTSKYLYRPLSIALTVQQSLSGGVSTLSCDNATVANQLLSALTDTSSAAGATKSFQCSDQTWVVSKCVAGAGVPSLCVNCADPCSAVSHCASSASSGFAVSPFSISPCVSKACPVGSGLASGVRLLSLAYKDFEPAPSIVSQALSSTRTSITVNTKLSDRGTVYCAASPYDEQSGMVVAPTSTGALMLQNFVATTNAANDSSVTISGLSAATRFQVYCMTVSRAGTRMAIDKVVAQSKTASTACCISILAQGSSGTVTEGARVAHFLSLSVGNRPAVDVTLKVNVFDNLGSAIFPTQFFPSSFTLAALQQGSAGTSSANRVVLFSASMLALPMGSYFYNISTTGTSAKQYEVSYVNNANTITVLSSIAPLPAPVLSSAVFADDGSYVAISFDANTDRGKTSTQFPCSALFSFACASTSTCVWANSKVVNAFVSSAAGCATVNSPVQLSPSAVVKALCQSTTGTCDTTIWQSASTTTSVVIATSNLAVSPTVSISAPNTIGACDSLTLDISGSSGNGGRPWLSRSIQVETAATANVSDLQHFLTHRYQASPPTAIPAALLSKGFAYNFVVKLCNFLNKCSQSSKSVLPLDRTLPTVSLPGAALRTTSRSSALTIGSDAFVAPCGSTAQVRSGLSYAWTVSTGGAVLISATSISKDPSKFVLAPYSLDVGKVYDVLLKVTITATAQSASAAVQVFVQPGSIFTAVALGTSRTVRVEEKLAIDAQGSYDEDQVGVTGQRAGLVYSWSCAQVQPMFSDSCSSAFTMTSGFANVQTFVMEAKTGAADAVVQVKLTIFDASFARSAESVITVTVLPSLSPVVTVSSNIPSTGIFNNNRELQLTGTVAFPAQFNGTAVWSVDDTSNFNFATAVMSPTSMTFLPSSTLQSSTIYLVIAANTLPGRSKLTFSLTAHVPRAGLQTVASVFVAVNAPPLPGTFMVSPPNGTEIVDTFQFLAEQWFDSDLPLLYQFAYLSSSGFEETVRSKLETAFGSSVLPAGLASQNFSVTCVVNVFDSHSAVVSTSYPVTVYKQQPDNGFSLSRFVTEGLMESASSVDGLKQTTSLGSYLLNEVDCSKARDCAALNRHACYRTANTCGECLSSTYVGDSGDSNTVCIEITTDFSPTTAFQVCDSTGECVSEMKTCAGNCSFPQGSCIFVHADTGVEVPSCFVGATDCNAVCDCTEDFIGSDSCSLNSTQLLEKQALRSQVIRGIQDLVNLEDADQATVAGWIGSVVSAAQTPDELSEESVSQLLDLSRTITTNAALIGTTASDLSPLLRGLNLAVQSLADRQLRSRRRKLSSDRRLETTPRNSSALVLQTTDVLHQVRDALAQSLLPGQEAVEIVFSQIRLFVQSAVVNAASGGNLSVQLPATSLESLADRTTSSVILPVGSRSDADSQLSVMNISLSSMRAELFNDDLVLSGFDKLFSNPVSLKFSEIYCSRPDCRFELTLQTTPMASELKDAVAAESFVTTCTKNDFSVHRYTCADSSTVDVTCDGTASVITTLCPATSYVPTCNSIAGMDIDSSECRVVSFTNTTVTCSCPLLDTARRALQGNNSATVVPGQDVSYVAMLNTVKSNFVNTITSADDLSLSTIKTGWSALVTVAALAIAIMYALYWSHNADKEAEKVVPTQITKAHKLLRSASMMKKSVSERFSSTRRSELWKKQRELLGNKDLQLAEQALPAILSSNTLSHRIKDELRLRHKWFGIVFNFSKSFPRVLRVLSLSTNMLIMLFIQSLTYSLTNPDDGECEMQTTETDCLGPRSPYATGESKCFWDINANTQCTVVQPNDSIKVILFVAIFSAVVSTPLALFVDWLLLNILAAPTTISTTTSTDSSVAPTGTLTDVESATTSANRAYYLPWNWLKSSEPVLPVTSIVPSDAPSAPVYRRQRTNIRTTSIARGRLTSLFGQSAGTDEQAAIEQNNKILAHADLRSLVEKIGKYREILTPEERTEFDAVWGLDEQGHFKTDEENQSKLRKCLNNMSFFRNKAQTASTGSVSQRVLMDLVSVHAALRAEEESAVTTDLTHKEKGKRLMFLFQRDLLPGISGKILESKGNRDNITTQHVSPSAKMCGWVFIGALNVGMLFYILLFALQESAQRQGAWATSFALWLVVEILLVISVMVVFTHIFIPSLIMKDVNQIKSKLVESIRAFNNSMKRRNEGNDIEEEDTTVFSTTDYLFISSRLAKKWPTLREAKIIAQFKTPWPKQSYQRELNVSKQYKKKFSFLTRSASILAMFFLTNLIVVPASLQDMIIGMCTTTAMGYTVLLHVDLYRVFPVLVIIPTLIIAVIVHFFIQSSEASSKRSLEKMLGDDKKTTPWGKSSKQLAKIAPERRSTVILDERTNLGGQLNLPLLPVQASPFTLIDGNKAKHTSRRASIKQGLQVLGEMRRQLSDQGPDRANTTSPPQHSTTSDSHRPLSSSEDDSSNSESDSQDNQPSASQSSRVGASGNRARSSGPARQGQHPTEPSVNCSSAVGSNASHSSRPEANRSSLRADATPVGIAQLSAAVRLPQQALSIQQSMRWVDDHSLSLDSMEEEEMEALFDLLDEELSDSDLSDEKDIEHGGSYSSRSNSPRGQAADAEHKSAHSNNTDDLVDHFLK